MMASQNGHLEVVRELLQHGAEVDKARTDNGGTPLIRASQQGHLEVVRELLKHGAEVDKAMTNDGATPLFIASLQGHLEVVRELLQHGAEVDKARTDTGSTPLMAAAASGTPSLELVRLLACRGADLAVVDVNGATAVKIARFNSNAGIAAGAEVADWLDAVAGHTAYQICARVRNHVRMRALLRAGGCDPAAAAHGTLPAGGLAAAAAAAEFPVCAATAALAAAAVRPWAPERHFLHPPATRSAVAVLLHVEVRLRCGNQRDPWRALPWLPRELWLAVLGRVSRGWWPDHGRAALPGFP
jgi:hypothetical protein